MASADSGRGEFAVERQKLSVGPADFPALPAQSEGSVVIWPVDLDGVATLEFGYFVEPNDQGDSNSPLQLRVTLAPRHGEPVELFHDQVGSKDFRGDVRHAVVDLVQWSGPATLNFHTDRPGLDRNLDRGGMTVNGAQQARVRWVNPRLTGRPDRDRPRPNVILICVDTLRADRLELFGGERSSMPLLEARLRKTGTEFVYAYANAGWSLPSMATLLTGRLPGFHHAGRRTSLGPGDQAFNLSPRETKGGIELVIAGTRYRFQMLHSSIPTIQEILAENGYSTAAVYKNGYINHPTRVLKGMDEAVNYPRLDAAVGTDTAVDWVDRQGENPFFLFLHYMDPHEWAAEAEKIYPGWQARPYDPALRERYLEAYDQLIDYTDAEIERFLEALEARGLLDNSYVVFTSDHGESFFEGDEGFIGHGDPTQESVMRIPLALWGPEVPNTVVATRVSLIDVVPTVLDLLSIPAEVYDFDGRSLLPLTRAPARAEDRTVVGEFSLGARDRLVLYRGDWKLILDLLTDTTRLYRLQNGVPIQVRSEEHPMVTARLLEIADRYRRSSGTHFRSLAYQSTQIDEETLQSLRALGYID